MEERTTGLRQGKQAPLFLGGRGSSRSANPERLGRSLALPNGFLIAFLLAFATSIRVWHLYHTEVTARDSIGFQRYAWELHHKEWKQTLRDNVHHPLYPLSILAMSELVGWLRPGSDLEVMQLSAQLASGLAGILLVVPMFYLGKELFDRRVGFWAAVLFQCLPAGARVLSDALSEPLFLLISVTGLLLAVRALRSGSLPGFALCGLCTGLAYLTRPEGLLLAVSVGLVLLIVGRARLLPSHWSLRARQEPRPPEKWRKTLTQLMCLIIPALMVAGPYIAMIGGFSNKTNVKEILNAERYGSHPATGNKQMETSHGGPLVASMVASWWPDGKQGDFRSHLGWSVLTLASEIGKGFFYVAWIPALVGLFWFRDRFRLIPGSGVLLVLCLLQSLALLRVAMTAGYVSDRHVLIIVLCGLYWAVAMVLSLGTLLPVVSFLAIGTLALTKTLAPLHANRAGHHAAGLWLAKHAGPGAEIIDPFCWAAHYAGRTFPAISHPPLQRPSRHRYIVHECRPDHRERYREPSIPEKEIRAAGGKVVYHWPIESTWADAKILIYDIPMFQDISPKR